MTDTATNVAGVPDKGAETETTETVPFAFSDTAKPALAMAPDAVKLVTDPAVVGITATQLTASKLGSVVPAPATIRR